MRPEGKGKKPMYDVTALGEILIDFTPCGECDGVPAFAQNPGGAPLNVLVQNAHLGGKTAFIGKVGADGFGNSLRQLMVGNHIETRGLMVSQDIHTTLAFVQLDEKRERSFSFYRNLGADIMLTQQEIDADLIRQSHIFHFGSLSVTAEPARSATLAAINIAKDAGCILSYDPNYRAPLWHSEKEAVDAMLALMPDVDLLKVSDEEMELLVGTRDLNEGSKRLAAYDIALVCISCGGKGSYFRRGNDCRYVPGYNVTIEDTNGAGDSFFGAVHYQLRNKTLTDINAMTMEELTQLFRFANAAGALTIQKKGAIPAMARLDTIRAFIREQDWQI